jgi:integrase
MVLQGFDAFCHLGYAEGVSKEAWRIMATIIPRKRANGTIGFRAQIMLRRNGKIVHRESQTFDRKQAASAWAERRERELALPGALERIAAGEPTLSQIIDRYIEESQRDLGRTKAQVLRSIKEFDLADMRCSKIDSAAIVEFAQAKLATGVEPQTIANYLSHLAPIFDIAKAAWRYNLDPAALDDAFKVARRLGLTKKSSRRERRPTLDELDMLMTAFDVRSRRRRTAVPMHRVIAFAIFSARRQEEIARLRWSDLDEEGKRILVRDMKDPKGADGNHIWCDLPEQALAIIKAMPKLSDEIFPYTTDAIGAAFTRECQQLEIDNLHFHDLRHEGVSRLFEMGLNIPHVAAVSGHRSWSSLQRYTHIRQIGDKYAGWKWLPVVTAPDERLKLIRFGRFPRRTKMDRFREHG